MVIIEFEQILFDFGGTWRPQFRRWENRANLVRNSGGDFECGIKTNTKQLQSDRQNRVCKTGRRKISSIPNGAWKFHCSPESRRECHPIRFGILMIEISDVILISTRLTLWKDTRKGVVHLFYSSRSTCIWSQTQQFGFKGWPHKWTEPLKVYRMVVEAKEDSLEANTPPKSANKKCGRQVREKLVFLHVVSLVRSVADSFYTFFGESLHHDIISKCKFCYGRNIVCWQSAMAQKWTASGTISFWCKKIQNCQPHKWKQPKQNCPRWVAEHF